MQPVIPAQALSFKARIMKEFKSDKKSFYIIVGLVLFAVIGGIYTGKTLAGGSVGSTAPRGDTAPGATQSLSEAGITDETAFPDMAEGKLEEGGINGEGTHHLVREGGVSQTVYLTSTVIDLQSFVGKNVQIWGQTLSAKQAGWLMDVGKLKVK